MPDDPLPPDPEPATPADSEATVEPSAAPAPAPAPRQDDDLPTPEELRAAPDATIRHAPKFGAFIGAGAIVGFFVALIVTALVRPAVARASDGSGFLPFLDGENAVTTVMVVTGAVVGGFVGALFAVLADRRSVRRTGRDDV